MQIQNRDVYSFHEKSVTTEIGIPCFCSTTLKTIKKLLQNFKGSTQILGTRFTDLGTDGNRKYVEFLSLSAVVCELSR